MATRLVELAPAPDRQVPLADGMTVGREGCDVNLADAEVSRRHARLLVTDDAVVVEDLGSRNGTYVNESRVRGQVTLRDGDTVRFGSVRWRLEAAPAPAATPPLPPPPAPPVATEAPAHPPPAPPVAAEAPAAAAAGIGESRGDVPAPSPPSRIQAAPPLVAAGPPAFEGSRRRRASAARRVEATFVCYAVIVATAAALIAYLSGR